VQDLNEGSKNADVVERRWPKTTAVLRQTESSVMRLAGDRYVFIEFGEEVLDFGVRAKVAELEMWLAKHAPPGFVESSPGIRSALLEYDPAVLPLPDLLDLLQRCSHDLCNNFEYLHVRRC
jgi:urea carboxylase